MTVLRSAEDDGGPPPMWRTDGRVVATSGHVAVDGAPGPGRGTFLDEARTVFAFLRATLEQAGSGMEHVLSVSAFITDWVHFDDFHLAYREAFGVPGPPRTTVVAGVYPPYRVEVAATAVTAPGTPPGTP